MEQFRERFLKAYANIPLNLRDEIILVIKVKIKTAENQETEIQESISWRVAYLEVSQNTPKSNDILEGLAELELI